MPTDDVLVEEEVNALDPDVSEETHQDDPVDEDAVKAHPSYKELEEKYSAARQGMDKSNKSKKELEADIARLKVLAGEEDEEAPQETKEDAEDRIAQLEWKLENKSRIDLVKDNYEKILEEGFKGQKVSPAIALELAEKQGGVENVEAERNRQETMSTESTTDRSGTFDTVQINEFDSDLGLDGKKKAELMAKYPGLKDM